MVTNDTPEEKRLQHAPFAIHATRGLIRDQKMRRRTMLIVVVTALVMIVSGSTILQATLNPHEHPGWFILFWLVCAWLAVTAILLAVFDLLMLNSAARKAQREMRHGFEDRTDQREPDR